MGTGELLGDNNSLSAYTAVLAVYFAMFLVMRYGSSRVELNFRRT